MSILCCPMHWCRHICTCCLQCLDRIDMSIQCCRMHWCLSTFIRRRHICFLHCPAHKFPKSTHSCPIYCCSSTFILRRNIFLQCLDRIDISVLCCPMHWCQSTFIPRRHLCTGFLQCLD